MPLPSISDLWLGGRVQSRAHYDPSESGAGACSGSKYFWDTMHVACVCVCLCMCMGNTILKGETRMGPGPPWSPEAPS